MSSLEVAGVQMFQKQYGNQLHFSELHACALGARDENNQVFDAKRVDIHDQR